MFSLLSYQLSWDYDQWHYLLLQGCYQSFFGLLSWLYSLLRMRKQVRPESQCLNYLSMLCYLNIKRQKKVAICIYKTNSCLNSNTNLSTLLHTSLLSYSFFITHLNKLWLPCLLKAVGQAQRAKWHFGGKGKKTLTRDLLVKPSFKCYLPWPQGKFQTMILIQKFRKGM